MTTTNDLQGELSDLRTEVAELRGQVGTLLALIRWGGAAAVFVMVVQTVAIVALAGASLSADASMDGFHVGAPVAP